jgi:hypothetical protein
MSATAIALIAAAVAIIAVLIAASRSGPRVTTIETRRETDDEDGK